MISFDLSESTIPLRKTLVPNYKNIDPAVQS